MKSTEVINEIEVLLNENRDSTKPTAFTIGYQNSLDDLIIRLD
ncbi:hypothetical protein [Gottfriedia acidiceleris]